MYVPDESRRREWARVASCEESGREGCVDEGKGTCGRKRRRDVEMCERRWPEMRYVDTWLFKTSGVDRGVLKGGQQKEIGAVECTYIRDRT